MNMCRSMREWRFEFNIMGHYLHGCIHIDRSRSTNMCATRILNKDKRCFERDSRNRLICPHLKTAIAQCIRRGIKRVLREIKKPRR